MSENECLKPIVSHLPCKPRDRTDPYAVYCEMSPQRRLRLSDMQVCRLPTNLRYFKNGNIIATRKPGILVDCSAMVPRFRVNF